MLRNACSHTCLLALKSLDTVYNIFFFNFMPNVLGSGMCLKKKTKTSLLNAQLLKDRDSDFSSPTAPKIEAPAETVFSEDL